VFPNHFARGHLFASKITTDPYVLADVNIECPVDRYPKFKIYTSELNLESYEYQYIRNTALHDLTLFKLNVARFVGTGSFFNLLKPNDIYIYIYIYIYICVCVCLPQR